MADHVGPAWMVIDATDAGELAIAAANGATHGLVQVKWDACQSTSGGAVTATSVISSINDVVAAGLKVCLRVSPQYIPTFVGTSGVKFKRNGAVEWTGVTADGNNVRDWVWSASTRAFVDDFYTKLFVQLDWSKIERVQLGGIMFGELSYPTSDGTQWWGYSTPAQAGTDLAAGMSVCPVPGHVPSTGSTWTANDIAFANWYSDSLNKWMLWLIAKHRTYFTGPIYVLHPGFGLRPNYHVPTSGDTARALGYREAIARGLDWARQVGAYPDAKVHPYSTWGDGAHPWTPDPYSDANDANAAAWYHLLRVARVAGRARGIWGENTALEASNATMDLVFDEGAVAHGYQGFTWLSHDSLITGTNDTYAHWATRIATAKAAYGTGTYRRGVNMAGAEFAASAATLPGTYGTDYAYDAAPAFTTIGQRGHRLVRLPFRWERVQPVRGAPLNATEVARIEAAVSDAAAAGMRTTLDLHNYGRYINSTANGGAELVLGDTLPIADFVDLWTRLSAVFKANANVHGYDLMNEPHDLVATVGSFSGTTRYDWNDGTVQGWTGDGASVANVSSKLRFTLNPPGSGFYQTRKDDAGTDRNGPVTGNVLQAEVTLAAGTPGTWTTRLQWMNTSFAWQDAPSVTYTRIDTGASVSSLIAGVAVRVQATYGANIPTGRPFAIQIESSASTAGSYACDVDNFRHGTTTGTLTAAQVWESASNQAGAAIRAAGDDHTIILEGHGWSSAKEWANNHPAPWATFGGAVAYGPHYYFDSDNSGDYPDTYATENAAAVAAGHANLSSRVANELRSVLSWAVRNGVRLFFGEIGWTNTADATSWNSVGETLYSELDRYAAEVTYWSAGARWGTGYNLSAYTGTSQDTIKAQASVIEAHLSTDTPVITPPAPPPVIATGLLRNLSPNPACAVNTTGITISPAGNWARSTSVDAGLSRTTGLEGTTAADVTWARSAVDDEVQYVVSFDLHAIGAQSFNCLVNYYDQVSGGTFLGNSTLGGVGTVPVVLAAGETRRFTIGPYTTPTDTRSLALKLNDIDAGGLEVTAVRVAPYSGNLVADGLYFDGGSTGWTWDGTAGSSSSTGRILGDAFASGATFSIVSSDIGPVQRETYTLGQSHSITALGSITDPITAVDGFLIMQLAYDAVRGRVRVSAFTFASSVTSVVVERKELNAARWTQIRGGTIPVTGGVPIYQADDYEYPSGVTVDYRIRGLNASGVTVQSAIARRSGVVEPLWLKFIPRPSWNRRVEFLRDPITYERESRSAVYQPQGAELPVVVTDVHGSRRFSVQLVEHSLERARALDDVLRRGAPCFLHVPVSVPIPSIYAAVGNYRMTRLAQFSVRWLFEIDLIEVAAPPPSVVGARTTWADVLATYGSWADVLAAKATWAELID